MSGPAPQTWRGFGLRAFAALAGLGLLQLAEPAQAAGRTFRLPSETLDAALVRFGVQGGVSVGGLPAPGCGGRSRPVQGTMTPEAALARMLPPGCGYVALDARTFKIVSAGPPRARPPSPEPSATNALTPLLITAERRPEPLTGAPYPASALAGGTIARLGGDSFEDIASQFVGVTVTNLGPGRNKIFVRGLSDGSFTGKTQSTVGLYLDDLPITFDAPDPDLRLVDIDRVEVLRGPQGTLYGSGSIGGIVRIVTARPDPAGFAGWAEVDGAVTEHGAASSGMSAMLNLPLRSGGAALRAVAYSDRRGGYIDNPLRGVKDQNWSRRTGGRLTFASDLGDGWRLDAGLAHQGISTNAAQYAQGHFGPLSRNTLVREPHDNEFTKLGLGLVHAGRTADLKLSVGYVRHNLGTTYDATGAFTAVDPVASAAKAFDDDRRVSLGVLETTLTSNTPGRLRWLVGAFATHTRERDSARLRFVAPAGDPLTLYRRRDELSEQAAYGEAAFDLTPRITLTAGLRLFRAITRTRGDDFGLAGDPTEVASGRQVNHGAAPKLRLAYAFAPDVVVYVQAQEGYRAGGFNLPSFARRNPGPVIGARAFEPDRLRSYEFGGVAPLFDGRLVARAAVFHTDWTSVQTDQYFANGLPLTVNVGDGSNTGLEAELTWRPNDALQVRASALLNDPQLTRTTRLLPATPDKGLPGVPYGTASTDLRYRWTLGERFTAEASIQASYVGRSYVTFDAGTNNLMGGYGAGRLELAVYDDRWRIEGYVNNLTDASANTFAFGNPFSRARAMQATPLRPRTVGARLARSF